MKNKKAITNQRTPEEIQEITKGIDESLPENIEETEDGLEVEEAPEVETPEVEEAPEVPEVPAVEPPEVPEVEKPKPALPPLEDRLRESGQEALILHSKNKKIIETIEETENLPEPTLDELKDYAREMGEDYDTLDKLTQNILKDSLHNKKKFSKLGDLVKDEKQHNKWMEKVDEFIDQEDTSQKYPSLLAKAEEFKKYCAKKTHMNVDFDTLVGGFFFSLPKDEPIRRNLLLPQAGGNRNTPPKPVDLTQDDAPIIRKKDMRDYMEKAKHGKIKIQV